MPWTSHPDPDDTIHDWLKSLYTTYRNGLTDPSVLPLETEIDWDAYWAGFNSTSFFVGEDSTRHINLGLGVRQIELEGTQVIRITHRWINAGKPPILKQIREFVTKKLHENISPLPSALTNAGIRYMVPIDSRMFVENNKTAQQDFWTLEFRIMTRVLNSIL